MQKFIKLPFLFLLIAASIGVLLRWQFVKPIEWLKYPFWLHAHSHLMFLGWIFNFLSIAFVILFIDQENQRRFNRYFLLLQVLLVGMLVSFPLQGYGSYSIVISSLHTVVVWIMVLQFLKSTRSKSFNPAIKFARISFLFFIISSIGPLVLPVLMVNGLAQSKWYYFSVYYYLHFQYNGVFIFGIFSLFFEWLNRKGLVVNYYWAQQFGLFLFVASFPAYVLSILWSNPGWMFNVVGFIAACLQLIAFYYLLRIIMQVFPVLSKNHLSIRLLITFAFLSFVVKLILQLLSAHPYLIQVVYHNRNYIMVYLHLVLVGVISFFLLAWSMDMKWIPVRPFGVIMLLVGFTGMEIILTNIFPITVAWLNTIKLSFFFSGVLWLGLGWMLLPFMFGKRGLGY